jgi:peptidoglycan/LPS O-acetylase OafA/YrhL
MHATNQPHRIAALDSLRGLAIVAVMLYHFADLLASSRSAPPGAVEATWQALTGPGWAGVDLFFVISGLLITGILLDTRGQAGYWASFLGRRALRIFPLYYGFLLVLLVLLPWVYRPTHAAYTFLTEQQAWYWLYGTNVLTATNGSFRGITAGYLWSLAVEEQFYLVWPFVIAWVRPTALPRVCVALFVGSWLLRLSALALHVSPTALYVLPFTHLEPLALGAWLATQLRTRSAADLARSLAPVAGLSALVLLTLAQRGALWFWEPAATAWAPACWAFVSGWLLVTSLATPAVWLQRGPLVALGGVSYAVYLFHVPIAFVLKSVIFERYGWLTGPHREWACVLFALVAGALSWAAAWVSWHTYERQWLRLKQWLPRPTPTAPPRPGQTSIRAA